MGRRVAKEFSLPTAGTLGILRSAAVKGYVRFPEAIALLMKTIFGASKKLVDLMLEEDLRRKESQA